MDTLKHELAVAQALIDRHFDIWNDTTAGQQWATTFPDVYAPDFFVADYQGKATGYASVAELITRVQTEHVGFVFTPDPVAWNHGVGRVTWGYGPEGDANRVRGEDIFTIENSKIASMRVFIDPK